jgi:hypothetical protein
MKKIFISHSSIDKTIADEICRFLETNGLSCWIAPRDVTPGKNYGVAIVDAIDECAVFLLILSSESNKSGQVVREVERAASSNSVIIPLRVELVEPSRDLEFYVSSSHWLDAPDKPLSKHLGKLLEAIKNWESGDETKPEQVASAPPLGPATPSPSPNLRSSIVIAGIAIVLLCAAVGFMFFRNSPPPQRGTTEPTAPNVVASPSVVETPTVMEPPTVASSTAVADSPTVAPSSTPTPEPTTTPELVPIIEQITASSELPSQMYRGEVRSYQPTNAIDENENTAWIPTKSGVREWIRVAFKAPTTIKSVWVYGGYGVDAARYQTNNRVRELRVHFPNGSSEILTLEDKMRLQGFEMPDRPVVEWLRFEIVSVYRGTKYDSTPISEIAFNRD